jgi:hypothetical protein
MAYIFLDESGDLGFKKSSSRWFIFTIAIVSDARALERVIRQIWKPLKKRHKKLGELHAYHADNMTRKRLLKKLNMVPDLRIVCVILNKEKVYIDLQNQKNYLYNYTANILLDRLHSRTSIDENESMNIYIDRKDTKRKLRDNFVGYLTHSMKDRRKAPFSIVLHSSHENKSLQAVDFISWAIFRKYEMGDHEFYEIIKNKISDERLLFP